jgi:hypothetical protein
MNASFAFLQVWNKVHQESEGEASEQCGFILEVNTAG